MQQGKPLFAATVLASVAVYGFHFFVSRRLGVDDYGVVAALLSAVTLVNAAAAVGATVVARFASEFQALEDGPRLRRLLEVLSLWSAILFAAALALSLAFRWQLAAVLRIHSAWLVVLAVLLATLTVAAVLLRGLLQGMQRFTQFALSFITEQIGRAFLASIFVALGMGVQGALVGSIIAAAGAVAYTYARLRSSLRRSAVKLHVDLRRLLVTSGAIAVATISLAMLSYVDLIFAKHYLTAHDAGLYGFAVLPGRALTAVGSFVPTWILPKSTEHTAAGKRGSGVFGIGIAAGAALSLPVLVVLYFFSPQIVNVIAGPAFAGAAPLIFPYGCAAAFFTLTSISASYQIGQHRFAFVVPLGSCVAAEIVGVILLHQTARQIIYVVLAANALGFAASLVRVGGRRPKITASSSRTG